MRKRINNSYPDSSFKEYVFIVFVTIVTYWNTWKGFFQQDEWAGLGVHYSLSGLTITQKFLTIYESMLRAGLAHFLPLVPPVNYLRYYFFGINYAPYSILSIFLHIFSGLLVFILVQKLSFKKNLALIASIIFITASASSQATMWVSTSLPTQLSFIFSAISVICWINWLNTEKRKCALYALISASLAICFKETSIFLIIFLPIVGILYKPKSRKLFTFIFISFGGLYALMRLLVVSIKYDLISAMQQTIYIVVKAAENYFTVVTRGVVQIIIPQRILLQTNEAIFSRLPSNIRPEVNTFLYDQKLENYTRWMMIVFGSVILLSLILFIYKKFRNGDKTFVVIGIYLLLSFIPLSFLSSAELNQTFLASRGLYIPVAAMSILVVAMIDDLIKFKRGMTILLSVLIMINMFVIREEISSQITIGKIRKGVLVDIEKKYPKLSEKTIIFTKSNTAYYGLPAEETTLPFQSGFGHVLMVWYYDSNNYFKYFQDNGFLWGITDQGYKEVGNVGFGYFRNYDLLKKAVSENNLSSDSVIAFSWQGEIMQLVDITEEIRSELKQNE